MATKAWARFLLLKRKHKSRSAEIGLQPRTATIAISSQPPSQSSTWALQTRFWIIKIWSRRKAQIRGGTSLASASKPHVRNRKARPSFFLGSRASNQSFRLYKNAKKLENVSSESHKVSLNWVTEKSSGICKKLQKLALNPLGELSRIWWWQIQGSGSAQARLWKLKLN